MAQQLMALCLQEARVGRYTWREWWGQLDLFDDHAAEIVDFLEAEGYLVADGDFLLVGPEAERTFGRRYRSDLTAVFSAAPEFTVLSGRAELGTVDDAVLAEKADGPRVLLLAGRSWQVTHVDWTRRRCWVEPTELTGKARWGLGHSASSFEVSRGEREVLLGHDPLG